jgi:hypothetical protein
MLQDHASSEESYERFIQEVVESQVVWGLRSEALGWANCASKEDENTDVILFWSDRADAASHQKEEWADHVPTEIEFDDFIDAWLQGMDEDGVMVGPNWDAQLSGLEVTAKALADRLLEETENGS